MARKSILINISGCHLGKTFDANQINGSEDLDNFLDVENVATLYATVDNNDQLTFARSFNSEKYEKLVVFTKIKPCKVPEDVLSCLQIASVSGPPILALYNTLNNIYSPLLAHNVNNVQKHIDNLQTQLLTSIVDNYEQDYIKDNVSNDSYLNLRTLQQEAEYWNALCNNTKREKTSKKSAYAFFRDNLAPLAKEFSLIDALPLNDIHDLLEKAHNCLDDLWRHESNAYPSDRMQHLMNLIAHNLLKTCTANLKPLNIWLHDYNDLTNKLNDYISLSNQWLTSCSQLTEIFWPNYPLHVWQLGKFTPVDLRHFVELLDDISQTRLLHKQLVRLLTNEEQANLNMENIFAPFDKVDVFLTYKIDDNLEYLKARKLFERLLQPAEQRVAVKLKKQLGSINANTRQLIYEFSRYSQLIKRTVIRDNLQAERQFLLSALYEYMQEIQKKSGDVNNVHDRFGSPLIVREMVLNNQLVNQGKEMQMVADGLLADLKGYEDLKGIIEEFVNDLKQQHQDLFDAWTSEIVSYIKNNSLSLKESDAVVEFSKQKLMRVNYSPRLVILISEVRQLRAMGYHIPSVIEETSAHAKKFMKHARILEQIANFHNTIGDRMIPSQKPMMLSSALELSKLVQEQEVVSWGNEKAVDQYVNILKNAVEKVSRENNLLTMHHSQIIDKIDALSSIDLIKNLSQWKETAKNIRNVMSTIEESGFKNMQTWKVDIDRQLCAILERQYIKSLSTLHLHLPEIQTDLIFRNYHLEFSPNEDALKRQYEQQLAKFLDIPKNFRGVADNAEESAFGEIATRNAGLLENVAKSKEELFEQLNGVLKYWQSWLQLEPLDKSKMVMWQHWDLHFRASKTFGQEIAKLPSVEEKVGCFLVGLSRLRSDFESHNRSYWDQLVYSLKDSIAGDIVVLQNYIDPATASLTKQPVTIEEIGETGVAHNSIIKELPNMAKVMEEMVKKSEILASWSREQVDSVNRLKGAWERLQSLLENRQHIIAKQMETIKTTLNIEKENLVKEIERFSAKFEQLVPRRLAGEVATASLEELVKQFGDIGVQREEWVKILGKYEELISTYAKFDLAETDSEIAQIAEVKARLDEEQARWSTFETFNKEFNEIASEYWIVTRKKLFDFEDFLTRWQNNLKTEPHSDLNARILKEIDKYQLIFPSLKFVKGDDFSEKHWVNTLNLLEMKNKPVDQLTLQDFLSVADRLETCKADLQLICKKAASEIVVRQALNELDQWEMEAKFVLSAHSEKLALVKDYKEILNKIGDNQSLLQSVKNSADYESFLDKATLWENKLTDLDHYVTALAKIQRKWIYLEPIFNSGTLSQEKSRFDRIDRDFRHILHSIEKETRVVFLLRYPNLRSVLETIQEQLNRCQSSLDNFLLDKRNTFPRFLFLSDDDLLEVVGQSSKEQVIQTHLKKIFAGIDRIELDADGRNIVAMCSQQGEVVPLSNSVNIQKNVEIWLNELTKEMQATLKKLLVNCQAEKQAPDPLKYPSQILCLSENINFTLKCEQAISSMTLPPLLTKYKAQLSYYSSLDLNMKPDQLDNILELKLKAMLLDTIHYIGIIEHLLDSNTTRVSDWSWQKQLRFYANSMGDVTVKMANARVEYSYEYLGNVAKLVQTKLTDRCFLTLMQAMHLGMGGNPYGPAGTGKTESVKALGALLGRQVLVFNCDEGVDAASMGRILSGLVRTGAWGCFDEFNRLDEATLSAVSMIIQPIQAALKSNQTSVQLFEQDVLVDKHCSIFVTLNPAGEEYGGRNKLPDNLKQLFRPVVMTHPDHELIANSLLHCDGYAHADLLAKKLIEVFELSKKLLSKQQHYDWGLRAIRTVLTSCGVTLKKIKLTSTEDITKESELKIVHQVLRSDTLSKLTYGDSQKFDLILENVFKCAANEITSLNGDNLVQALKESFDEAGLVFNENQLQKCLEMHEQLKQRMGVAIVGPPSSGKTTIRALLFNALNKLNKNLKQYSFNPKSMTRSQLLGRIDIDTKQWNDGVLTSCSLKVAAEPTNISSWIICDGDVDPEWIESLNSVLDDNRLLSLPSGWRIQFGANVNFLFETHDLQSASPATISRIGIVLQNEHHLELRCFVNSFIRKLSEDVRRVLEPLINDYFYKAIDWIVNEAEVTIAASKLSIAFTGLSQLVDVKSKSEFVVKLIYGLGQQLHYDFREIFTQQMYEWTAEVQPPLLLKSKYNADRDIIDSYYTNPNVVIDNVQNGIALVLTGQIQLYLDVLQMWLMANREQPFILVGPHGSAKSLILNNLIADRSDVEMVTIYCSANLSPSFVENKLIQYCISVNTHKGKVYKPKKGKLLLHLKNLHLLRPDKWGTNMLIEFLNQVIVYKGFYDKNVDFVGIENVTIIGSLVADGGGELSTRFASNVCVFNVDEPDREDLNLILIAYLSAILKATFPNQQWPKPKVSKLILAIMTIYDKMKYQFLAHQFKHYNLSPHDLVHWMAAILRYKQHQNGGGDVEPETFVIEIIAYEALRIFGDKLATSDDYNSLKTIIDEAFQSHLSKSNILESLSNLYFVPENISHQNWSLAKFSEADWQSTVQLGKTQFEREGQTLDIIINKELLHLVSSVFTCLSANYGNILLIGKSGIGRRCAVKVVSALQGAKLIVPGALFHTDLKQTMQLAGVEDEQVFLQLEDHILANEEYLNVVNLLLSSGEVPGLFNQVELDSLVKNLKDDFDRDDFDGNLVEYFAERVKRKLHLVVCLDVDNEKLRTILSNCPALVHSCRVVWKTTWSNETIEQMPGLLIGQDSDNFAKVYRVISAKVSCPSSYVDMINLYRSIYEEKYSAITLRQNKLTVGVAKISEASQLVETLKAKAAEQQIKLAEKQAKANSALDMISSTMQNANTHKEEMETLKKKTNEENKQLIHRKQEIEEELSEVEPLIQQARSAVGNLKSESLSEIRSLRAPPEIIRDILEGVLRLMGIQDTSWNSMKTFLAKRGVKEEIRSFDASRITSDSRHLVEKLIKNKSDSFEPKSAKRASVAAAPLAAWVLANVKYSYVMDKIRPLEREQNKLKQNLTSAENQLDELSVGLSNVDETVLKLKEQLSAFTKEAAAIEIDLNRAQENLGSAETLVSKLDEEFLRWQDQLKELDLELKKLPDFCLLAAAMAVYLAKEQEDSRKKILNEWCKQLNVADFQFESFLCSERDQLQLHSEGLPDDKLSVQNAVIILKSHLVPLLIDPNSNAVNWIKNHLRHKNIETVTLNSPKFGTTLELAIRFGKTLIVEEVENLNPILLPILRREFNYQGERKLLRINNKLIDYHNDFKLVLCSRNEQLVLPADVAPLVNVLNFTVTHAGLTEQLLSAAIRQENPELETRRKMLLREKEELEEKQHQYQSQLLEDLASSSGDILQNTQLVNSLNDTKASSNAITLALAESNEIQSKLQAEFNVFRDISTFASLLFFACNEFSKCNILYLISARAYTKLFLKSLQTFQALDEKFEAQKKHLFCTVYEYMSRGIFKTDRLKFALHLVQNIFSNEIRLVEWNLFLGNYLSSSKIVADEMPGWVPKQSVLPLQHFKIELGEAFKMLQLEEKHLWTSFMSGDTNADFPQHCKVSPFQKLLVIQALRPDRLYSAIKKYLLQLTGLKSLDPGMFHLSHILKESSNEEPILLLTMSGTDPSIEIRKLDGTGTFIEIAMGEGQEQKALTTLQSCIQSGCWLILKNLHLVTSWLTQLAQHTKNIEPHQNFRLWLISEPTPNFNFVLAQNSFKIVYETPQGLCYNLQRSFATFGAKFFDRLNPASTRVFFAIAYIHAILQERRKFIPQGWSKFYEFSDNDFGSCIQLVEDLWVNGGKHQMDWKFIGGLCSDAVYSGRIENLDDMEILYSYTRQYLRDEVLSHKWKPIGMKVDLPNSAEYQDYINAIKQLPHLDEPKYFGLPDNIERAWEKQTCATVIKELKSIYVPQSISMSFNREMFSKGLSSLILLWKKLNQGYGFVKAANRAADGDLSCAELLILEEYNSALHLVQIIHKSFATLNKICKGVLVPDEKSLALGNSLINFKTPMVWKKTWNGPSDPSQYLRTVINKAISLEKWVDNLKGILRKPLNLTGMFYPDALIAAHKQDYSKSSGIPLDELFLETSWRSQGNVEELVLSDLLVEGALFDGGGLKDCTAQSENVVGAPNCYLSWTKKVPVDDNKLLDVPLYATASRENKIVNLQVQHDDRLTEHWIQCSVAFYLEY